MSCDPYYGVWDTEQEHWIADADTPSSPISYVHPFLAKAALDMYHHPGWQREGRYEVRVLPSDTDGAPLSVVSEEDDC